jgi:hypothetical protein
MPNANFPFYPIIYVRGYAMRESEKDDTAADPFCGFNLGSTVYRGTTDKKKPAKFVFESPVLRLMTEYDYSDVYHEGQDVLEPGWQGWLAPRSIIIYRYYDQDSTLLGTKGTHGVAYYAKGLSDLIVRARDLICHKPPDWDKDTVYNAGDWVLPLKPLGNLYKSRVNANQGNEPAKSLDKWWDCGIPYDKPEDFRCYLVAHSMGGLICRAFLQDPDDVSARDAVEKFFTYATPHNGIDMGGINVPSWLTLWGMDSFDRETMAKYLKLQYNPLYLKNKRVDYLPEKAFDPRKVFCMVGTNRADYQVAMGLSRTFAGNGSDGLVKIENASLQGARENGEVTRCATAYTYRSHSGYFGIVNNEESYQNLTRFLFGDMRVDIWVDVKDVRVPDDDDQEIEKKDQDGLVDAVYQFELLTSPLGKPWYLSRRIAEEDSVACLTHREFREFQKSKEFQQTGKMSVYLSTVFLADRARLNPKNPYLTYSMFLGVKVPDYEVERKLWLDKHFEGAYLYRDRVNIRIGRPANADREDWTADYQWLSEVHSPGGPDGEFKKPEIHDLDDGKRKEITIGFEGAGKPGITGQLRFEVSRWNLKSGDY